MNQTISKILITTALVSSICSAAESTKESTFKLTGNVQAQAIKALYDNDADNTGYTA